MILSVPLILIFSHRDRRQAEPLVLFLREALNLERDGRFSTLLPEDLKFSVEGVEPSGRISEHDVRNGLINLGEYGVAILVRLDENYVRCLQKDGDFRVEWRDGSASKHFLAVNKEKSDHDESTLSFEITFEIFIAFSKSESLRDVEWRPITV